MWSTILSKNLARFSKFGLDRFQLYFSQSCHLRWQADRHTSIFREITVLFRRTRRARSKLAVKVHKTNNFLMILDDITKVAKKITWFDVIIENIGGARRTIFSWLFFLISKTREVGDDKRFKWRVVSFTISLVEHNTQASFVHMPSSHVWTLPRMKKVWRRHDASTKIWLPDEWDAGEGLSIETLSVLSLFDNSNQPLDYIIVLHPRFRYIFLRSDVYFILATYNGQCRMPLI